MSKATKAESLNEIEVTTDYNRRNRVKRVGISYAVLELMLKGNTRPCKSNLPADARIVEVAPRAWKDAFEHSLLWVVFESASWPELSECEVMEEFVVAMTRLEEECKD